MKPNIRKVVVACAAALCIVIALTAYAQMQKAPARLWEYRDGANLQLKEMNAYGEEGWELVQVVVYGRDYYYIFKRPR